MLCNCRNYEMRSVRLLPILSRLMDLKRSNLIIILFFGIVLLCYILVKVTT